MKLNLLVLRTTRLEEMRTFYSSLGARCKSERHGSGPDHYAATLGDDFVLELYPGLDDAVSDSGLRLGVSVDNISETLGSIAPSAMPRQTNWGLRALVRDPDGRTIELVESKTATSAASQIGHAIA